jgi:hypothetical protein
MDKVRYETSGPLGILTLANPPLNLFSAEVIEDLRAAVTEFRRFRSEHCSCKPKAKSFPAGPMSAFFRVGPQAKRASVSPAICD